MILCSKCGHVSSVVRWSGAVAYGQGSAQVGPDGVVQAVGPVQLTTAVKTGTQLPASFNIICTNCGHTYSAKNMILVKQCVFTGAPLNDAQEVMTVPDNIGGFTLYVGQELAAFAATVALNSNHVLRG